ncbi:MAG: single-stranded DNA-binding protein [Bacteroidales bacterium]|nr:single-stranded DNA-binding protein [Bacteroidales bacterium]
MSGVNKGILIGNLGRDPEVLTLPNGQKKARVAMATSEFYKNKNGERVEQTEWHSVVFYRGLAEVVEKYLKKGSAIYVEGRLRTRVWEDKGEKRYFTEIEARDLTMLGSGNGGRKSETPSVTKGEPVLPSVPKNLDKEEAFYDPAEDALPF